MSNDVVSLTADACRGYATIGQVERAVTDAATAFRLAEAVERFRRTRLPRDEARALRLARSV